MKLKIYVKNDVATNFDRFGVEHIPKEIKAFIGNKIIKTNIYGIQVNDSVMCGYNAKCGYYDLVLCADVKISS